MNVYDFDKTIYKKDSSVELYKYVIRRKPTVFLHCFGIQVAAFVEYKSKKISKESLKTAFFSFLKYVDIDSELEKFVDKEIKNINRWYIEQKESDDIIISASPEFLVKAFADRIDVKNVIASEVDKKTGTFLSNNCHGEEKVVRFRKLFQDVEIDKFYSDSKSDLPMAKISKKAYLINGEKIIRWDING